MDNRYFHTILIHLSKKMESAQQKLPPNPNESSNFLSKLFFVWTLPFFKKGYKQVLTLDDMYQPLTCDRSESLGDRLEG